MYETGSPVHNLMRSLTAPTVRIINAAKHCNPDCEYGLQMELGAKEIQKALNQFAVDIKEVPMCENCRFKDTPYCESFCPLSEEK